MKNRIVRTEKTENIEPQKLMVGAELPIAAGRYANLIQCSITPEEFILDFCTRVGEQVFLNSRVIISPMHAQRLVKLLEKQIANHGKIRRQTKQEEGLRRRVVRELPR